MSTLLLLIIALVMPVVTAFSQSANLDQSRNGSKNSPINPVQWVNGNAGASNSHYLESLSIPYRMVITGLTPGTHTVDIEWDVKQSGKYAIDYITHYNRLSPHQQFGHAAESINPLQGLSGINSTPITFPIPNPVANILVSCSGFSQPLTSFNALPANERVMTLFNGTGITSMQYLATPNLSLSTVKQGLRITFTTTNASVVFAWGGHIAAAADWCPGNSASKINGSPYHMRLVALNGSGGNQDRSLSAAAIVPVPPCDIIGSSNICNGQQKTYSVNPYIGYTYTWSLANNTSGASISGTNVGSSVLINSGNVNGSFTLNLVMATSGYTGNCSKIVTVGKPTLTESHLNYSCGSSAGSINLTATGGFAPYTYSWSNGAVTEDISGLAAGTYTVAVSDQASCTSSLTTSITALTSISVNPIVTNASCYQSNTGSVSLTVSGGSSPYSYSWSNGATTSGISSLAAGTYSVTVKDAAQCTKSVSVTVAQPAALTATSTFTAPTCFSGSDGTASVLVSGGTAPYSYSWNTNPVKTTANATALVAGTYTCYITDSKGCKTTSTAVIPQTSREITTVTITGNTTICAGGSVTLTAATSLSYLWSNGATTQSITVSTAGSYLVSVTTANGCAASSAAVTVVVNAKPTVSATGGKITCKRNENVVTLGVSTSAINPTYTWSGTNFNSTMINPVVSKTGTYTVVVTDGVTGCSSSANAIVTVDTLAPVVTATGGSVSCLIPTAMIQASSATVGVSYSWNGPNGFASLLQNPVVSAPGSYNVFVANPVNECVGSATAFVTGNLTSPSVIANGAHISCKRGEDTVLVSASSVVANCTYSWTGPNNYSAFTANAKVAATGNYQVVVTNPLNGCSSTATVVVSGPLAMTLNTSAVNTTCFGSNNGSASVSVIGGTAPLSYQWLTGTSAVNSSIQNQYAGTYTVVVTDADECVAQASVTIAQPTAIVATPTVTPVTCRNEDDGAIALSVSGGAGAYQFSWNTGAITSSITNLIPATYACLITDAIGCTTTQSVTIAPCNFTLRQSKADIAKQAEINNEVLSEIYPNPAKESATINARIYADSKISIKIYSVDGALISELYTGNAKADELYQFNLNTSAYRSGMYLVKIQTESMTIARKLLVE